MATYSEIASRDRAGLISILAGKGVWAFALAHFVSYLYRTVNAIIYPDLARDLGLAANSIGLLTGAYLFAFAAAQLPIGVALDRYGARKVQVPLLMVAAAGAALFAHANSLNQLIIARGLIGLGVAGSLMAAIKAGSLWLPKELLPLFTAILLSVGGLGAMASTVPMHAVLHYTDWRGAFTGLGIGTVAVSLLILLVVPKYSHTQQTTLPEMAAAVKQLYSSWSFWRLALYSIFAHATYLAVQGLWMGSWLRDVAHLDRTGAATVLLAGTVAMVAGSLTFGWITDYVRKFDVKPMFVCGAGIGIFMLFQCLMVSGTTIINFFIIAVGFSFFGTATTMNYAIIAQSVPTSLTGRVSTSFNLLVFLLAFVLQWGVGNMLNHWIPQGGAYPTIAYQYALGTLLAMQLPGLLLWLSFKPWERNRALPIA